MTYSFSWPRVFYVIAAGCFLLALFGITANGHPLWIAGLLAMAVAPLLP